MCLLIQGMLKVALPSLYIPGKRYCIYGQPAADNDKEELRKLFKFLSTIFNVAN
jgi:hypothetical protein